MRSTAKLQIAGLVLAFLLLGGLAYYSFSVTNQLAQKNTNLEKEVGDLQNNISEMQGVLTQMQISLVQSGTNQSISDQQIASAKALLQVQEEELLKLSGEVSSVQAGNITALTSVSRQLQNLSADFQTLEGVLQPLLPAVLIRTSGAGLASYVEDSDGLTYLRLVEDGATSGVESALASEPFNASIAGNSVAWKAVANAVAGDSNHRFWPMVLENSPAGTDAIEFSDSLGNQECAVVLNGVRTFVDVVWNTTVINTFKIVVVSPGQMVDFYINGVRVAIITQGVPSDGFLLMGAEVGGWGISAPGVATLDAYGGMLGSD